MTSEQSPGLQIRAFQGADRQAVAALWRLIFPAPPAWNVPEQDIDRKLGVQPELFLLAHLGTELAGTVMAGFDGHRGWIHLLAVSPEHRNAGVGSALMLAAERGLEQLGCTKVNLQVRVGNEQVVSFYTGLGYSIEPRVSMGKRLG